MCEVVKAYQREQFIAYYFMHILLGMPGMQAGQVLSVHHTRIRRYVILHLHSLIHLEFLTMALFTNTMNP